MKRGPFAMWPAFPTSDYYGPLRLPLGRPAPSQGSPVIGGHRFPSPRRRRGQDGSPEFPGRPSARSTPNYAGGSFSARFWIPGAFHGLRRECTGSAPSTPARRRAHLTTLAQASLALQTARSHPSCFAPGLSTTHEDIATRDPDVSPDRTHTGRPSRTYRSYAMAAPSFTAPEQSRRTHP